MIFAAG
jgi:arginyl-tRNA synthetase